MSELLRLKAELERQDRAFATVFAELESIDPSASIAVSAAWMSEVSADHDETRPVLSTWAIRG